MPAFIYTHKVRTKGAPCLDASKTLTPPCCVLRLVCCVLAHAEPDLGGSSAENEYNHLSTTVSTGDYATPQNDYNHLTWPEGKVEYATPQNDYNHLTRPEGKVEYATPQNDYNHLTRPEGNAVYATPQSNYDLLSRLPDGAETAAPQATGRTRADSFSGFTKIGLSEC